jgi:hypothetical protein
MQTVMVTIIILCDCSQPLSLIAASRTVPGRWDLFNGRMESLDAVKVVRGITSITYKAFFFFGTGTTLLASANSTKSAFRSLLWYCRMTRITWGELHGSI